MPFGASISCAHFQQFLNVLKHLVQYWTSMRSINNYLDEFLFVAATLLLCNYLIQEFLDLCQELGVPIALDKTEWGSLRVVFLGILLDGQFMQLVLPKEKCLKVIEMFQNMVNKRKAMVKDLQTLCGYLNFLNHVIVPGRAFTRRMYSKFSQSIDFSKVSGFKHELRTKPNRKSKGFKLKQYHPICLDSEFKLDCGIWLEFLTNSNLLKVVNWPMLDVEGFTTSQEICFYSDASRAVELGFGCILQDQWIFGKWPEQFITTQESSIEYLELFAMTAGILTWQNLLQNRKIIVFCDNMLVVHMVNGTTSKCKHCMKLIRLLTLNGLQFNHRLNAKYVSM